MRAMLQEGYRRDIGSRFMRDAEGWRIGHLQREENGQIGQKRFMMTEEKAAHQTVGRRMQEEAA